MKRTFVKIKDIGGWWIHDFKKDKNRLCEHVLIFWILPKETPQLFFTDKNCRFSVKDKYLSIVILDNMIKLIIKYKVLMSLIRSSNWSTEYLLLIFSSPFV